MAEGRSQSENEIDSDESKTVNIGNPGHTLTEGSSDEDCQVQCERPKKKKKWVPKIIIEKRRCSTSDDSDKENPSHKRPKNDSGSNSNSKDKSESEQSGELSPLYQNQMGHPDYPFYETASDSECEKNGTDWFKNDCYRGIISMLVQLLMC